MGQPYWPEEREGLLSHDFDHDWIHSGLKDVALPYVYQLYDKFVKIIEGKED